MAVLRTQRLAAGSLTEPTTKPGDLVPKWAGGLVYTVPAGYRAVIRDMRIVAFYEAVGATSIVSVVVSGVGDIRIWQKTWAVGELTISQACQVVCEPGDAISISTNAIPASSYYISGAVMPLPVYPS